MLAWGAKVSPLFRATCLDICGRLGIPDPSWLMACMAFETGETFSPSIRNGAGSGAVGLIQFMPQTAAALGTSIEDLSKMTAEEQLAFVYEYFIPRAGRLRNLGDVYAAILWPGMIGKTDDTIIFRQGDTSHPKLYLQNKGLDLNHDGNITRGEVVARVYKELTRGLTPPNNFNEGAQV